MVSNLSLKLLSKLQFVWSPTFIIAKRKQAFVYNDNLKLGFTSVLVNGEIRPQFVLCLEVLTHGSLKGA